MRTERREGSVAPGFLMVAAAAALWGTDSLFRRGLALELPPGTVVFIEHAFLVLITLPFLIRGRAEFKKLDGGDRVSLVLVGVGASALATALFTAALSHGDPVTPLLLQKLQPLIAALGATLLLGEKLLPRYGVYLVAAVTGAFFITFPDPTQIRPEATVAALLAVGAAALWGMGTVLGRKLTAKMLFETITAARFAIGLPASAVIVATQEGRAGFTAASLHDMPALLLLAIFPGLVALLLYYRGLGGTPASAATLAELAFPLSAITISWLVFETVLTGWQWFGVIMLTGTITIMSLAAREGERALGVESPVPASQD